MNDYLADFRYVEFIITFGCNYNCSYCFWVDRLKRDNYLFREKGPLAPRTKLRKIVYPLLRRAGVLDYADAFLNYDLERWKALFRRLFKGKNAYLSFTGGEPLLLWKQVFELIEAVDEVAKSWIVRFDTNGTVVPPFPDAWRSRISFNVSCHRSQMKDFDVFMQNLQKLTAGARSVMVNRVVHAEDELAGLPDEIRFFKDRGFFLNIAPDHFILDRWSPAGQKLLTQWIAPIDFELKMRKATSGKKCIYPTFGLQLLPNGFAWVPPCDTKVINLMKTQDPAPLLSREAIACPAEQCVCLHQYSFITADNVWARNRSSMDILGNYVSAQAAHRASNGS